MLQYNVRKTGGFFDLSEQAVNDEEFKICWPNLFWRFVVR